VKAGQTFRESESESLLNWMTKHHNWQRHSCGLQLDVHCTGQNKDNVTIDKK